MVKEQPVKWFPDSAARFIELLRDYDWNTAVKILKRDKESRQVST